MSAETDHKAGYVAIVGRPNVGKSTLLNHILGSKLSITSRKPQTTRQRLLGIHSTDNLQMIFVDTPGLSPASRNKSSALNHYMYLETIRSTTDVDVCVHLIDADGWSDADEQVSNKLLLQLEIPVICALNKIDLISPKSRLLPVMQAVSQVYDYKAIIPVSALKNQGLDILVGEIGKYLPQQPKYFEADQLTDKPLRFLIAEWIREQVVRQLGEELPYRTTVMVESYKEQDSITLIDAIIYVERESQKSIVIGKGGRRIKAIGSQARRSIEKFIDRQIHLDLRVRTKANWTQARTDLATLGYQ